MLLHFVVKSTYQLMFSLLPNETLPDWLPADLSKKVAKRVYCVKSCEEVGFCLAGEKSAVEGECMAYVECVKGVETKQRCPIGTLFDADKLSCEPFWTVKC